VQDHEGAGINTPRLLRYSNLFVGRLSRDPYRHTRGSPILGRTRRRNSVLGRARRGASAPRWSPVDVAPSQHCQLQSHGGNEAEPCYGRQPPHASQSGLVKNQTSSSYRTSLSNLVHRTSTNPATSPRAKFTIHKLPFRSPTGQAQHTKAMRAHARKRSFVCASGCLRG
jgi:hypothetical protein